MEQHGESNEKGSLLNRIIPSKNGAKSKSEEYSVQVKILFEWVQLFSNILSNIFSSFLPITSFPMVSTLIVILVMVMVLMIVMIQGDRSSAMMLF